MVLLCIRLGLDQIVVGVAIVLTAEGVTAVLHASQYGDSYPRLDAAPEFAIPVLSDLPVLGGSLFSQPLPVYIGFVLVAVIGWLLGQSSVGLHLRAAGEQPASLDAAGVSVVRVRTVAELVCGALAGVAGAYLAIVGAGTFVPFVTNGMGFIAIVIAMLARGRPWWSIAGAFLFGMSLSLTTALQLVGIDVPVDVVQMLPFVSVMVVLIIFARDARLPVRPGPAVPARGSLTAADRRIHHRHRARPRLRHALDLAPRRSVRARRRDRSHPMPTASIPVASRSSSDR